MVLRRLNGETQNTSPMLTLVTQFGGGKTHAPMEYGPSHATIGPMTTPSDICPFPPPTCPDLGVDEPFDERLRGDDHGCGDLGLALDKHLAGCPTSITERDFIMWARAGDAPTKEQRWALREALLNMSAREIRFAVFDGRASTRQICRLVAQCGGAETPEWSEIIRILHPEIPVPKVEMNPVREKALMWDAVGDGLVQVY